MDLKSRHFVTWPVVVCLLHACTIVLGQQLSTSKENFLCQLFGPRGSCLGNTKAFVHKATIKNDIFVGEVAVASPRLVDLDGDGDLDLVIGTRAGTVHYLERLQDGSLIEKLGSDNPFHSVNLTGRGGWSFPEIVDVDGDNRLDAVIGSYDGTLEYYKQTRRGFFTKVVGVDNPFGSISVGSITDVDGNCSAPHVLDFDGDGDLDVAVGHYDGTVHFFERQPDGSFNEKLGAENPFDGIDVGYVAVPQVVDLDYDGDLDAVIGAFDGSIKYYQRLADGSFEGLRGKENPFGLINVGQLSRPFVMDVDGDEDLDALVGTGSGELKFWKQERDQSFVEKRGIENPFKDIDLGDYAQPFVVDFDGDNDLDAIVGLSNGGVLYFERHTDGSLVRKSDAENPFRSIKVGAYAIPRMVDVNGDNRLDAVVGNYLSGTIHYFQWRTVDGSFVEMLGSSNPFGTIKVEGIKWGVPQVIDFDGDNDLDVVMTVLNEKKAQESGIAGMQQIHYFEQQPDGSFLEISGIDNPLSSLDRQLTSLIRMLQLVDFDGDKDLDAVIFSMVDGKPDVLLYFERQEDGSFVQVLGSASPFQSIATPLAVGMHVIDFDGDHDLDVVVGTLDGSVYPLIQGACASTCSHNGLCSWETNKCKCFRNHGLPDCSGCSPGYFGHRCVACPGVTGGQETQACSQRGLCDDGRRGSGICQCTSPSFLGPSCSQGHCPAGSEQFLYEVQSGWQSRNVTLYGCQECPRGKFKSEEGSAKCKDCALGTISKVGATQCDAIWVAILMYCLVFTAVGIVVCLFGRKHRQKKKREEAARKLKEERSRRAQVACSLMESELAMGPEGVTLFTLPVLFTPPAKVPTEAVRCLKIAFQDKLDSLCGAAGQFAPTLEWEDIRKWLPSLKQSKQLIMSLKQSKQLIVDESNERAGGELEVQGWTDEEREELHDLIRVGMKYMNAYLQAAPNVWDTDDLRQHAEMGTASAYADTYNAVHDLIKAAESESYGKLPSQVERCQTRTYQGKLDQIEDNKEKISSLYLQGIIAIQILTDLLTSIARDLGAQAQVAPLKGIFRVLEKLAMRPRAGVPWDVVRGQLICDSVDQIVRAIDLVGNFKNVRRWPSLQVVFIQVNNRFANPAKGWADVGIYLHVEGMQCDDVVCEIQIVHCKMMLVREQMGAHDSYDGSRFAAELMRMPVFEPKSGNAREEEQHKQARVEEVISRIDKQQNASTISLMLRVNSTLKKRRSQTAQLSKADSHSQVLPVSVQNPSAVHPEEEEEVMSSNAAALGQGKEESAPVQTRTDLLYELWSQTRTDVPANSPQLVD